MKFLFNRPKKQTEQEEKTVLFVCVENAGRSQMAEGFFRKYAPRGYSTISSGTRPAGEINSLAIQGMKEVGIDISKQKSKIITDDKEFFHTSKHGMHGQGIMSHIIHS
jgi:arsenate reductase (thioredoxin)